MFWLSSDLVCNSIVISQTYFLITVSSYEAILATEIKVKGQIGLPIVFWQLLIQRTPNIACVCYGISWLHHLITASWYKIILGMEMMVKVHTCHCTEFQQLVLQTLPKCVKHIYSLMRWSYHVINHTIRSKIYYSIYLHVHVYIYRVSQKKCPIFVKLF